MTATRQWIVTDVDGTLLDASGGCLLSRELLDHVRATYGVVLASSRTREELFHAAEALGLPPVPCIAEDGQVLVHSTGEVEQLGMGMDALLAQLDACGIGAVVRAVMPPSPDRVASLLVPADALRAFPEGLPNRRIQVTVGGRWATITDASWNKGRAARRLMAALGVATWTAIGNGPNDASLLADASRGFVVREADGTHHPSLVAVPRAALLTRPGTEGWAEMIAMLEASPPPFQPTEGPHAPPSMDDHSADDPGA